MVTVPELKLRRHPPPLSDCLRKYCQLRSVDPIVDCSAKTKSRTIGNDRPGEFQCTLIVYRSPIAIIVTICKSNVLKFEGVSRCNLKES